MLNNIFVEAFLMSLILLNLFIFIFEINKNFCETYYLSIKYFELFSVGIFSIEYILRVLSTKQLKEIFKPIMLIDLFSVLPFYLALILHNNIILAILGFCKFIRIAKILRYKEILIESFKIK